MHNFAQYNNLLDQYNELSEDQVADCALYHWDSNNSQCIYTANFCQTCQIQATISYFIQDDIQDH